MILKNSIILTLCFSLNGCALFSSSRSKSSVKLPKVPPIQVPGGSGSNWRYLGTSDDGDLAIEIDDSSITSSKTQIYNFEDRKTIIDPKSFSAYAIKQPHYKYILSSWQLDCTNKQYIINNATIYNESGIELKKYNYNNDSSVKWINIGNGSIANLQYNYICLNRNRNLGY